MMYGSIAMREMARQMASPKLPQWRFGEKVYYDISGMVERKRSQYSIAQAHVDTRPNVTNLSYVIRNILLRNIDEHLIIENYSNRTDDYILRPIALFDVAYSDLQDCASWPMNKAERDRYDRTMKCCSKIFNRFYRGMSQEQIYLLNVEMEKLGTAIKHDYDILYYKILEALSVGFANDQMRQYTAKLCVIHVCVDLPMKYFYNCLGKARIRELEHVSNNVNSMMVYYATNDEGVEGDINLNHSEKIRMALKAFQNKYLFTKMVNA